jgi:hypothetical protein
MKPWLRTALWIVFWATLLVSLLVGAFAAWLLTEVVPPGTVISVDSERFVLPAFTHFGHWLTAVLVVFIVSLLVVFIVPVLAVLALVVPAAIGALYIALSLLLLALLLWPFVLLARWWWKGHRKPTTISP